MNAPAGTGMRRLEASEIESAARAVHVVQLVAQDPGLSDEQLASSWDQLSPQMRYLDLVAAVACARAWGFGAELPEPPPDLPMMQLLGPELASEAQAMLLMKAEWGSLTEAHEALEAFCERGLEEVGGLLDCELPERGTCARCGCTAEHACEGGCSWVVLPVTVPGAGALGLCSRCSRDPEAISAIRQLFTGGQPPAGGEQS